MSMKKQRDLEAIAGELQAALSREVKDIIAMGHLLIEARSQLDHGQWLPWLEVNFGSSTRTAENYMAAARFAAKYEMVANLKLRPSALYMLGAEMDRPNTWFNPETLKTIFKEAETKWVNDGRAEEIAISLLPDWPSETVRESAGEDEDEAVAADDTEIEEILDGPPPDLPPAPDTTTYDVVLSSFEQAVNTLSSLQTKPLGKFSATACKAKDVRAAGDFLREVADALDGRSRPQAAA
jgi:hypothetical protein